MNKTILVYDIEVTPYSFIYGDFDVGNEQYHTFVISKYRDDREKLKEYSNKIIDSKSWQCGFNNLDYDYPMLHFIIQLMNSKKLWNNLTVEEFLQRINEKNKQLIPDDKKKQSNKYGKNYNVIYNPFIKQIDLYKIHHFDNSARRSSLKKIEINMRFPNVQDFDWNKVNDYTEQVEQELIDYNINDVNATKELYYLTRGRLDKVTVDFPGMKKWYSQDRIEFRQNIGKKYEINIINASDVKIGEEIAKHTYLKKTGKTWKQIKNLKTFRQYIYLKDLIPDYIEKEFKDKELVKLLQYMKEIIIDSNKPEFDYVLYYAGIKINIGLGGIHSDDKPVIVQPTDNQIYSEWDVSSMYSTAMISRQLYPEHLGIEWLDSLIKIKNERVKLKPLAKKDKHIKMIVDAYKLALNGNYYGKTGDKYNYQYDIKVKYATTIKCQLDILLLIQLIINNIPNAIITSTNTDGVDWIHDKKYQDKAMKIKQQWEDIIQGSLEITSYKKKIARDVNNYIAIKEDDSLKLKGIFELEKELHKDFSNHIVTIALVDYFTKGISIEKTIRNHKNIYDFLSTIRVQNTKQGQWKLYHNYIKDGKKIKEPLQKINRYYVSNNPSHSITKHLVGTDRFSFIEKGYNPIPLNIVKETDATKYNINYRYYEKKAHEIINVIENKQLSIW